MIMVKIPKCPADKKTDLIKHRRFDARATKIDYEYWHCPCCGKNFNNQLKEILTR